jgi:hypothetical protein
VADVFSGDPANLQRAALSAPPLLLLLWGVGPGLLLSQVRVAHFSPSICSFFASPCSFPCSRKLLLHMLFLLLSLTSTQPVTDALLDLLCKLDPEQSGKLEPDPEPHQSEKVEVLGGPFGALQCPNLGKSEL